MSVTPQVVVCDWPFLNQLLEESGPGDLGFGKLGDAGESDDPRVFFAIDCVKSGRFLYFFSEFGQAIGRMVEAYPEETRSFVQFAGPLMCLYCDGTNEMLVNYIRSRTLTRR